MSLVGLELRMHAFSGQGHCETCLEGRGAAPCPSPPFSPLKGYVGHKAHNHGGQDGAVDRDEVVSGASSHHGLGAAHHCGHHICHCTGHEVLLWRYLRLLGAGGGAV